MLTIDGRILGRKKPLFGDWSIPLPPDLAGEGGDPLTLRRLIARIVREEVRAFRERQAERKVFKALTAAGIEEKLAKGKVSMGGTDLQQEVDEEQAVGAALQAFEDGLYLVVLDGEEQRDLDQPIHLHADSRITFVRLVMLSGA